MTFKKIIALLLAMLMVVPGLQAFAADEEAAETVVEKEYIALDSTEFKALRGMGMLDDTFAALSADDAVSRAVFLGALSKVAGITPKTYGMTEIPFIDINPDTPYANEICHFHSLGYVNGTAENIFSPDDKITYRQAAKIILDVCGYSTYVRTRFGSSLNDYANMAKLVGLLDGLKNTTADIPLDAEDAVTLLFNAGKTPVLDISAVTNEGYVNYASTEGKDLFAVNSDLYFDKGVMECDGLVSLLSYDVAEGFVIIDGEQYIQGDMNLYAFAGNYVEFFYHEKDGIKTLKWAGISDKNSILELSAEDLAVNDNEYSMECIVYWDGEKRREVTVSPHANIIYNNSLYNDASIDDIKPLVGRITLIDNNQDKAMDIVMVEEIENIFVIGLSAITGTVTDKYGAHINLADYERVEVYREGIPMELTDISVNTVISLVRDRNKKLAILHINGVGQRGKVETIKQVDGRTVYVIDGVDYQISPSYLDLSNKGFMPITPVIGTAYAFFTDKNGYIAEIQKSDTGALDYAYTIAAAPSDDPFGTGTQAMVRLLLGDGTIVTAHTNKKIKINGESGKTGADLLADARLWKEPGVVEPQVIMVAFNAEGKITQWEFALDNRSHPYGYDEAVFSYDYKGTTYKGSYNQAIRWGKYPMDARTKFFVKYTGLDIENPYGVSNGASIANVNMTCKLYDIDRNMIPKVATSEITAGNAISSKQCIVTEIYEKMIEGEPKTVIKFLNGGTSMEYPELFEGAIPESIKRGDVVTVYGFNGQCSKVTKTCSLSERIEPFGSGSYPDNYRIFGYIYGVATPGITMLAPTGYASSYGKVLPLAMGKSQIVSVTIYDVKNDTITKGAYEDICPSAAPLADGTLPVDENTMMAMVQRTADNYYDVIIVKYQ